MSIGNGPLRDADDARSMLRAALEYLVDDDGYRREDLQALVNTCVDDLYEDVLP